MKNKYNIKLINQWSSNCYQFISIEFYNSSNKYRKWAVLRLMFFNFGIVISKIIEYEK